jgi:hypothetical protein
VYTCIHCHVAVEADERESHSASQTHQDNGGSSTVVDEDYERAPRGGPTVKPHGTSNFR